MTASRRRPTARPLAALLIVASSMSLPVHAVAQTTSPTASAAAPSADASAPATTQASDDSVANGGGGGGDTTAVAINTKDGSDVFRLAFQIRRATQEVVDNTNAAVAVSSCTDCETIAISIQVVLVTSDPDVVAPTNLALAYNYLCTACETLASAYQFVTSTGGSVSFTAEGNRQLAAIRRALHELATSDLPIEEIQARLHELIEQLAWVLANELIAQGPDQHEPATSTPSPTSPPSASAAPETQPSETGSPSASGSPSPIDPPTSSATPTEDASP